MRLIPSSSVDIIITDPPYDSLERHRNTGGQPRLRKWFDIFPMARIEEMLRECYRVLRRNSHCYVFCDHNASYAIKPLGEKVGFTFWKPLIWDKKYRGLGYHYRGRYEMILFFEKGKRMLNDLGVPDVLEEPRLRGKSLYPTQKPVALAQILLRQSSSRGDTVLDPFTGSGAFGVAAVRLGRNFLGADSSHDALMRATAALELEGSSPVPWPSFLTAPVKGRRRR